MSWAVKEEPVDSERENEGGPRPCGAAEVDVSLAALAQFHECLKVQHMECSRAFASLQMQIVETVRLQEQALTAARHGEARHDPGSSYYAAASGAVKAASVLFRYLFEGLFAHQLDACQDLASGLERAVQRHQDCLTQQQHPQAAEETATAVAELRGAICLLRQVPARVQQVQRDLLPEMPLMMGPPQPAPPATLAAVRAAPVADAHRGPRTGTTVRSSAEEKDRAILEAGGAAPAASPAAASSSSHVTPARSRRLFAVSASYNTADQQTIASLVKRRYKCGVYFIPPSRDVAHDSEEAAAVKAGCCCLVTEEPIREQHTGTSRPLVRTSMAHLCQYSTPATTTAAAAATATAVATAVTKPQPRVQGRRVVREDEEGRRSGATGQRAPPPPSPPSPPPPPFCPHASTKLSGPDEADSMGDDSPFFEDEDEDAELMQLLEKLDEEARQHSSLFHDIDSSLSSPLFSQSQRQQQQAKLAQAADSAVANTSNSSNSSETGALSSSSRSSLTAQFGDEHFPLLAVRRGKRSRPFTMERASTTSFSRVARHNGVPGQQQQQRPLSTEDHGSQRSSREGSGEREVIPSQMPPLSMMESQTVQYQHVDSAVGGGGWRLSAAAALDPSNELERALVASRPPPRQWLFQVSNSCRDKRKEILEAIRGLGSEVDTGNLYNPEVTHLVVAEGITERTEKYLSACAAGRFIVPPRYVLESARRGHWLLGRMAEFNTNPLRRFFPAAIMEQAERGPSAEGAGAGASLLRRSFAGWRVLLLVSHPSVATGISTVLRAGGCEDLQVLIFNGSPNPVAAGSSEGDTGAESGPPPRIHLNTPTNATATDESGLSPGQPDPGAVVVGCSVEGFVDGLSSTVVVEQALLESRTHILVECLTMSCQPDNPGNFELPPWMPRSLVLPALYPRIYTLELLYYCLCTSEDRVFSDEGVLVHEDRLIPACRVEPFEGMPRSCA